MLRLDQMTTGEIAEHAGASAQIIKTAKGAKLRAAVIDLGAAHAALRDRVILGCAKQSTGVSA